MVHMEESDLAVLFSQHKENLLKKKKKGGGQVSNITRTSQQQEVTKQDHAKNLALTVSNISMNLEK